MGQKETLLILLLFKKLTHDINDYIKLQILGYHQLLATDYKAYDMLQECMMMMSFFIHAFFVC